METADIVLESGRQSVHCLVRKLESALELAPSQAAADAACQEASAG